MKHINTGCLYEKEGQKITIWHEDGKTHMIDHSRMIGITFDAPRLSVTAVMMRYVENDGGHLDVPMQRRMEIEALYGTAEFIDWSSEYRELQEIRAEIFLERLRRVYQAEKDGQEKAKWKEKK